MPYDQALVSALAYKAAGWNLVASASLREYLITISNPISHASPRLPVPGQFWLQASRLVFPRKADGGRTDARPGQPLGHRERPLHHECRFLDSVMHAVCILFFFF